MAVELPDLPPATELFDALLAVSLTGVILFQPIYADTDAAEIIDLAYVRLNASAQRMLKRPERPEQTFLTLYPHAIETGIFAFYRDTFLSGTPGRYDVNYQYDDLDNFFQLAAYRSGSLLVVSFSDTSDHERSAAELALRESHARERAALAEADRQRKQLQALVQQAPVAIAFFDGPTFQITAANERMCAIWGRKHEEVIGLPLLEALPELRGQGFDVLLRQVMLNRVPFTGTEEPATMWREGQLQTTYYNFVFQPLYDEHGEMLGVADVASEVTEQVLARQLVEDKERQTHQLNEELAATNEELAATNEELAFTNEELASTNEELQAANEEIIASNDDLYRTQHQLRLLNDELEARVQARTHELTDALREAQRQRELLRVQEDHLQQILGQVPAYVATLSGPEHRFSFFNTPYHTLSGGRAQLGLTVAEVFPEVVEQGFIGLLDEVYATGEPFVGTEVAVSLYDPATDQLAPRYVDFVYQPLTDEHGRPHGILAFIIDTTDKVLTHRRAEALQAEALASAKELVEQRETLYQIFEQTPAVIALLRGPEHQLEYFNGAYSQLLTDRPQRGLTIAEMQPEAVGQGFIDLLDRVFETGETFVGNEVPLTIAQPNGQPSIQKYLNFTYQAYQEGNQTIGISVFAYDVTEQVLLRRQQTSQQAQLAELFAQAPVAIAIFRGPEYVIEVANPSIAAIWGRKPEQIVGKPMLEALPEVRDQGFKEVLDQVVATGEAFVAQEVTALLERRDKLESVYLNFVYQPLRDANKQISSVAVVATEVSEQVATRQQVAQANRQLTATNAELDITNQRLLRTNADLDNFIYTASHDLKAPIINIEGLLAALREEMARPVQEAEVPMLLDLMQESIERFKRTIYHLTDIIKLQKVHEPPTADVDLAALVESVRLDLLPQLTTTQAQLTVDLTACPSMAFAEKNLRSIVFNLLSNALKYRHPDRAPQISVHCYPADQATVLEVQDNGLGLRKGQQEKLFGLFQRLHNHVEGSGIGLYMVKKIIENAGGHIEVESQFGVGSTFRLYFPK
jgi:PAS domain S-box-containing protein